MPELTHDELSGFSTETLSSSILNYLSTPRAAVEESALRKIESTRGSDRKRLIAISISIRAAWMESEEVDPEEFGLTWSPVLLSQLATSLSQLEAAEHLTSMARARLGRGDDQTVDRPLPVRLHKGHPELRVTRPSPIEDDPVPKSPWAKAIGFVYTTQGIAGALSWDLADVLGADQQQLILSVETADGNRFYPTRQVKTGRLVNGLSWIIAQLDPVMNRYDMSAWLNQPQSSLDGTSIWDRMESTEGPLAPEVKELVEHLRWSWSR